MKGKITAEQYKTVVTNKRLIVELHRKFSDEVGKEAETYKKKVLESRERRDKAIVNLNIDDISYIDNFNSEFLTLDDQLVLATADSETDQYRKSEIEEEINNKILELKKKALDEFVGGTFNRANYKPYTVL